MTASSTTIVRVQNSATTEPLVHVEASGNNPITSTAGEPTFYGRLVANTAIDNREPLGTVWNARYLNGGSFTGGTGLTVWQDPGQVVTPVACGNQPAPFPLVLGQVIAFDEQEHPTNLCLTTSDVSPNTGGAKACFPLEAQRVNVATGSVAAAPLAPPAPFGWLFLNLDTTTAGGLVYPGQAWVTAIMSASGRFSVGFEAITLDRTGTVILMP